jgi:rubrerythrin
MAEEQLPTITCSKCGHTSVKRVTKPLKCPYCGTKYNYEKNEVTKP